MSNNLRLLIIEDSVSDAKLVLRQIQQAGYELTSERVDTAQALKATLESQTWDIVISDYSMPSFNGLDALQIVRSMTLDIPFIMISGVMGEDRAVETMRSGAQDYVMKDHLQRLIPAIERELREAKERQARRDAESKVNLLSEALAQSASLVLMTNPQGIIEYANPSFYQVSGYDKEAVIGECIQDIINIDDHIWDRVKAQGTFQDEILNKRKDGATYWTSLNITSVQDTDGVIRRCLILQEDITERKLLELELQHYTQQLEQMVEERTSELSNNNQLLQEEIAERKQIEAQLAIARDKALEALRLKSAILGNINHDIQTPLNIVSLYSQMLKAQIQAGDAEKQIHYLEVLVSEMQHLSQYFKQLLNLADVESRNVEIQNAPFSPTLLLDNILSNFKPLADTKNLQLNGRIVDGFPDILFGDSDRLYQIAMHLVNNAIQFTDEGQIDIEIKLQNQYWSLAVQDTGRGIPPEYQEQIFDLFSQVDMSLSRITSRGSGLGLAMVRQYTELMKGDVFVQSNGEDGSTFTIRLPLLEVAM